MKSNCYSGLIRARDFLLVLLGLIFLSPLFLFVAVWIKSDSKGPIFFKGDRVGKGGKIFKILKFRTMYETASSYDGPKVTGNGDPRITKAGKWLRDSKLNELPQLWNVLIGEMSLVGPRPEDPEFVKTWPLDIRDEILSVRPGITSPASVLFRDEENMLSGTNPMDQYLSTIQPSKLRLDQLYVRHRSFLVDLDVIMWTFLVLLPGLSSYKPPERMLYVGIVQRLGLYIANWFIIDFFIATLSIIVNGLFWRVFGPIDLGITRSLLVAAEFAVVFTLVGAFFGIQKIHWSKASPIDVGALALSSLIATFIMAFLQQFPPAIPIYVLISASITTFFGYVVTRFRFRLITGIATRFLQIRKGGDIFRERVLIIGSGDAGLFAAWLLENSREASKFKVVGFVDDDYQKQGGRIRGLPILGGRNKIPEIVEKHDVGILLFAIHNISEKNKRIIFEKCKETTAQLIMFPNVIDSLTTAISSNGTNGHGKNGHGTNGHKKDHTPQKSNHQIIYQKLDAAKYNLDQGDLDQCLNHIDEISQLLQQEENHANILEQ